MQEGATEALALPPILSPTLPSEWEYKDHNSDSTPIPELPSEPLSPSLPETFVQSYVVKLRLPQRKAPEAPANGANGTNGVGKHSEELKEPDQKTAAKPNNHENPTAVKSAPKAAKQKSVDIKDIEEYRRTRGFLQKWIHSAQDKKHKADDATADRQHRLAAVISIDTIVCFIIAFDFEDRAERIAGRRPHPRSWQSLIPYLRKVASYLESVDAEISGLCSQISAVIRIHIAHIIRRQSESESATEYAAAISDFKRGLTYLPTNTSVDHYKLRSWLISDPVRNARHIDPINDQASLPLHVLSTPQDAAALAYHVAKEWCNEEKIDYDWICTNVSDS